MLYFTIQKPLQDGIGKVPEAAGARWRFYPRISSDIVGLSSDYPRIVFLLVEALQGVAAEILRFQISWQAQYLVRLEGDLTWSTHWKWGFICDADHCWHSFCVAGAVFGHVPAIRTLLHALEMTLQMRIVDDVDFVWQGQYLVRLEGDFSWQAQHFVTFWEIAGARNVVFYNNTKSSPRSDREGLRSGGCEMTILSSDMIGLSPNRLSIGGSTSRSFR